MKTPIPPEMLMRDGRPIRVQKVPMSTGKRKFKNAKLDPSSNEISPFERFKNSNNTKGRTYSH